MDYILDKPTLYRLLTDPEEEEKLFLASATIRKETIGNGVYLRGLVEISNVCTKDCLYCGIRKSNTTVRRYTLTDDEVVSAATFAHEHNYGSIVLQGGERCDRQFTDRIEQLLKEIKCLSNNTLGVTLSLGEQSEETYARWFDAGAHRYLLRIESSNEELYYKIHPHDELHAHSHRLECLRRLHRCGYQVGTGVMIGLPFQTIDNLIDDLFFFRDMNIDMVGMGPYLEHEATPLYSERRLLLSQQERLTLSLRMIACLRLLLPDINIAATTALQAIHPLGRERALTIGANVVMPNITPLTNRANYKLYENKPGMDEGAETSTQRLIESVRKSGCEVILGAWGDSRHFHRRQLK